MAGDGAPKAAAGAGAPKAGAGAVSAPKAGEAEEEADPKAGTEDAPKLKDMAVETNVE